MTYVESQMSLYVVYTYNGGQYQAVVFNLGGSSVVLAERLIPKYLPV